jgi:hypothetical protein
MPDNVRLISLSPAAIGGGRESQRTRTRTRTDDEEAAPLASERVPLVIAAEAKSDEDLNRFIDNLFDHSAFTNPNLITEVRSEQGDRINFNVHVIYMPRNPTPGVTVEEEPEVVEEGTPAATPAPSPAAPPADDSEPE